MIYIYIFNVPLVCVEVVSFSKSLSFIICKNSALYFFTANKFLAEPTNPNFDHIISVISIYTNSRSIFSFSNILLFSTNTSITLSHLKTFINTAFSNNLFWKKNDFIIRCIRSTDNKIIVVKLKISITKLKKKTSTSPDLQNYICGRPTYFIEMHYYPLKNTREQ